MLPEELVTNKTGVMEETIDTVLAVKHPHAKKTTVICWRCTTKRLFLFIWILHIMWLNILRVNVLEIGSQRHGLRGSTGMSIKIRGGQQKTLY